MLADDVVYSLAPNDAKAGREALIFGRGQHRFIEQFNL